MKKRPRIRLTLLERKGPVGCHHGHQAGDSFDFDTERGKLCPMAMHVAFPYVDILRYGGEIPGYEKGTALFSCPVSHWRGEVTAVTSALSTEEHASG